MTDTMDIKGFELLSHVDFGGAGDCMQIMENRDHIYVGHMGYNTLGDEVLGTSVVDVSDKRNPKVVHQIPIPVNTHSHKTQVANDVLMVNHEQQLRAGLPCSAGLKMYDISSPANPVEIGWLPIDGLGVHRMWWAGEDLTYFSVRESGYHGRFLMSADVSDPSKPEIVSRWWYPGQWTAGGETPTWADGPTLRAHHIIARGDRGYGGWGEAGLVIFDLNDREMRLISEVEWASEINEPTHTHTALPLPSHRAVAVTDEPLRDNPEPHVKRARIFDITDETSPKLLSLFPEPEGDFTQVGGRYGPHNLHENRPGTFVSEDLLFMTYFAAGLRAYDVSNPADPREVARFVPPAPSGQVSIQLNDVYVSAEGIVYVSDRMSGGVYILQYTG